MEAYIELVIIDNFVIDYILLFCLAKILKYKTKKRRIIIGACIGAVCAVITPFLKVSATILFLIKICMSCVIVYSTFSAKKVKKFLLENVVFFFLTFLLGGVCFALGLMFSNIEVNNGVIIYSNNSPIALILGGLFIFFYFGGQLFKYFSKKQQLEKFFYKIELLHKYIEVETVGYVDSANYIVDKITQKPVILITKKLYLNFLNQTKVNDLNEFRNMRKIQISTISDKNGQLPCFSLEKLVIYYNGKRIIHSNIIVAISGQDFSEKVNAEVLLSPYLLN